jgi:FtsH-binding integral membrane protein
MFQRLNQKLKGFRTFIGAGIFGVVGALALLGEYDLTPLVQLFVKNPDSLPLAMLGVAVFFGALRYFTDTDAGGYRSANQAAPAYKGVDAGE